jgi:hypothetical protein
VLIRKRVFMLDSPVAVCENGQTSLGFHGNREQVASEMWNKARSKRMGEHTRSPLRCFLSGTFGNPKGWLRI